MNAPRLRSLELFDARTGAKLRSALRAVVALVLLIVGILRPTARAAMGMLAPAIGLVLETVVQLFVVDTDAPFTADEVQ